MSSSNRSWEDAIEYAVETHVGMRRSTNQDAYAVAVAGSPEEWNQWGHLFLVADGMGAHAAGELASKIASDNIPHLYRKHPDLTAAEALRQAVAEANAEINRKGQANEEFHNMGTTCSVLTLLPQGAVVAHVGDSRVYRLRQGRLEQLTFDHSLIWELQAAGHSHSGGDAPLNLPRNVITRSLGPSPDVKVDLEGPFPTEVGDTFLLCSDGLVGEVADDELGTILNYLAPREAVRALVDLANFRGGSDNVTVAIARIADERITSSTNQWRSHAGIGRNSRQTASPINLLLGVTAAACLLAGIGMFLAGNPVVSTVASAVGGICGLALLLRTLTSEEPAGVPADRAFGKGPYSATNCQANRELIKKLEQILDEVREAAIEHQWTLDWDALREMQEAASSASQRGREREAVQSLTSALSSCMDQLRNQKRKR